MRMSSLKQVGKSSSQHIVASTLAVLMAIVPIDGFAQDSVPNAPTPQNSTQNAQNTASPQHGDYTGPQQRGYHQLTEYGTPRRYWPNPIAPYTPRDVPPPSFANTSRIDQSLRDGKLMLSLSDAIALALENNLDIAIARYNLPIADSDVLRTRAGNSLRGVNTGVVQGTPGGAASSLGGTGTTGAQGGGAGGTSTGAGGAGAGSGGIVNSTLGSSGPGVEQLDPALTGTLQLEKAQSPQATSIFTGVRTLNQNTGLGNFALTKGFLTGTDLSVSFNNNRQTTNSRTQSLNPLLNTNFRAQVRQHLLQGFGISINDRLIRIARNNREITDISFRLQVTQTVAQIQNIYWDLVSAYETVKAQERAFATAQRTLSDTQKQVQIGTLAPIEIVSAQSQVASVQQSLIVAQTNLELQQLLMKNAVSKNLTDPVLAAAPVIPTDTMNVPDQEPVVPIQDLVNDALSHRPELAQSRITLTNYEINIKGAKNGLLPALDVYAFYGASSIGGQQNALATCPPGSTAGFCTPAGTITPSSYGNTFSNLFNSSAPDKGVGVQLSIPIFNRSAQADQVRSELEYRQAQMLLQQLENQIRIQVRNAQYTVQQNRALIDSARKGQELAAQNLDAEQKKYSLGASTPFNVLQMQRNLATAESSLVSAMSAYEKSRVTLDQVTGNLLDHLGIRMDDAETGSVKTLPTASNVKPNPNAVSTASQDQQQQLEMQQVQPQTNQPPPTAQPPQEPQSGQQPLPNQPQPNQQPQQNPPPPQ